MSHRRASLEDLLEARLQTLALTLAPRTMPHYRSIAHRFLAYLHAAFPQVRWPTQLRRDPHLLGWLRSLSHQQPPPNNQTRIQGLVLLRRLLEDLAAQDPSVPHSLIHREDFPPQPHYLPRPLSLEDDQLLQQELRRTDDLRANALLLMRATGVRIGECTRLPLGCLRQLGPDQWAVHVPLGKLHTERLVPVDPEVRRIVARILALRAAAPPSQLAKSQGLLLPRRRTGCLALYVPLSQALAAATKRAGCATHVTLHQLRHSYATEMLRLGVSLPTLMQLLGHRDIRMTLRYTEVTQQDIQREFHQARHKATQPHRLPEITPPKGAYSAGLPGIRQALAATRHLLEMYRRQVGDEKTQRKLQRLNRRLLAVASLLDPIATAEK